MNRPDNLKTGKEREETDASLLAERATTDAEFAKTRLSLQKDADQVVEVARERADEMLQTARERADSAVKGAAAAGPPRQEVRVARAAEDAAIVDERSASDERLRVEREERQSALAALVLEREATDDGLIVERARADESLAARDDFLGMVSHDLRNMLHGVVMSAGLLGKHAVSEGDTGGVILRHANNIQRLAARMNRLVGDLLDVVSLEAGQLHLSLKRLDATQVVEDAVEAFAPSFLAKGVTLKTDLAAAPALARFDRERILQVLANLLSNALKFTEQGGHVVLSLAQTESGIRFSVADTGVGIPVGQQAVIFERFRRVGPADRSGHGLGLYIAKCIVDGHGGSIGVEGAPGGGAVFHFTLPSDAAGPEPHLP